MGYNQTLVQNMLWSKKSWVRTIFVSKKTLDHKKFKVSKKRSKNNWRLKFGFKTIHVQKIVSRKFLSQKIFLGKKSKVNKNLRSNTQFVNCEAYLIGEWNQKERKH